MDTGTQSLNPVDTKDSVGVGNRDKIIKFRVNPKEDYLLNEVDKKLGFGNVSTTLRWLVEHYPEIEKADVLVKTIALRQEYDRQIERLIDER